MTDAESGTGTEARQWLNARDPNSGGHLYTSQHVAELLEAYARARCADAEQEILKRNNMYEGMLGRADEGRKAAEQRCAELEREQDELQKAHEAETDIYANKLAAAEARNAALTEALHRLPMELTCLGSKLHRVTGNIGDKCHCGAETKPPRYVEEALLASAPQPTKEE